MSPNKPGLAKPVAKRARRRCMQPITVRCVGTPTAVFSLAKLLLERQRRQQPEPATDGKAAASEIINP